MKIGKMKVGGAVVMGCGKLGVALGVGAGAVVSTGAVELSDILIKLELN